MPSKLITTLRILVVGLITDDDETAYREVTDLAVWCQDNNLFLNVSNTRKLIVDYRKQRAELAPIHIKRAVLDRGSRKLYISLYLHH